VRGAHHRRCAREGLTGNYDALFGDWLQARANQPIVHFYTPLRFATGKRQRFRNLLLIPLAEQVTLTPLNRLRKADI
jgi:hypothetical protein